MTAFSFANYFANPVALALLIAVPLLAATYRYGDSRRRASLAAWGRAPVARPDSGRRAWKRGMQLAACAALAIALARPAIQSTVARAGPATGDLVFLLDVSRSMLADDVGTLRLYRARQWIGELAAQSKGQRLGLVAFAGSQSVQCPLTPDRAFFEEMVDATGPDSVTRGGSKLGDAIRFAAAHAFDDVDRDSRTLVLISDGEDQENSPVAAAREAARRGIRMVAIGIGDPAGGAMVPESVYDRTPVVYQGRAVSTRLDGATLGAIAAATKGGEYVPAGAGSLDAPDVYRRLLAPGGHSSHRPPTSGDTAWMACLVVAILLLAAEFRVPERRLLQAMGLALALLAMPVASFAQAVEEVFAKGVKALEERRFQDAVYYFANAARFSPDVPEIRFNLGQALYGLRFYPDAAGSFEMAAKGARQTALQARCKLGQGNARFKDAEQLYSERTIQAFAGKQAVERMRAAVAAYREAQELNPELFDAEYNRKIAERRLAEMMRNPFPPRSAAPAQAAASPEPAPDAERVLKEMRRPAAARTRVKGRGVERDW